MTVNEFLWSTDHVPSIAPSVRAFNVLERAISTSIGCKLMESMDQDCTVLHQLRIADIVNQRGCGDKTTEEIVAILSAYRGDQVALFSAISEFC